MSLRNVENLWLSLKKCPVPRLRTSHVRARPSTVPPPWLPGVCLPEDEQTPYFRLQSSSGIGLVSLQCVRYFWLIELVRGGFCLMSITFWFCCHVFKRLLLRFGLVDSVTFVHRHPPRGSSRRSVAFWARVEKSVLKVDCVTVHVVRNTYSIHSFVPTALASGKFMW